MTRPPMTSATAGAAEHAEESRSQAIIDIGSNSIRLVIYRDANRVPALLLNEKVLVGLGKGVAENGRLDPPAVERAVAALRRFALLIEDVGASDVRAVATAAVRDAVDGGAFLDRIRAEAGLEVELLAGEDEARASAMGVISGIPWARGVMGDLGGGSLELVRIADGAPRRRLSLPLGSLRMAAMAKQGSLPLGRVLAKALQQAGWGDEGAGEPFYMVGGSWRALAHVHMNLCGHPLPMVHQYEMPADSPARLIRALARMTPKRLKGIPNITGSRLPTLPSAASLLAAVTRRLQSSTLIASAYGLREGLLFASLPEDMRALDPLIEAARAEGARQGRFPEHGDLIDAWMAELFGSESAEDQRLRRAACLLADVGWRAHPDYRADRGLDVALHGNWVGIDGRGRAMLAAALYANFGGVDVDRLSLLEQLAEPADLHRARLWGLALRLAQRLSGGTARGLVSGGLRVEDGRLMLRLPRDQAALYGEAVVRRHKSLATALRLTPDLSVD